MSNIKLHLGCGLRNFGPDWVHVDGANYPHIKWHDVTKLRYDDNSVGVIYASHLIAYFSREEIVPILKEWYRVLKVGGVLRLATPDWAVLRQFESPTLGPIYGETSMGDILIYHKRIYIFKTLKELLEGAGFIDVKRYDHRLTDHPNTGNRSDKYDDCSAAYINGTLISLNMEAIKP